MCISTDLNKFKLYQTENSVGKIWRVDGAGGGGQLQQPSMGGVQIFSGMTDVIRSYHAKHICT